MCTSYTYAECQRICELYVELNKRNDAGIHKHYVHSAVDIKQGNRFVATLVDDGQ